MKPLPFQPLVPWWWDGICIYEFEEFSLELIPVEQILNHQKSGQTGKTVD